MSAGGTNELLLKAALLQGEPALRAWEEWKRAVDLRNPLDPECYRMLPLLYGNLRALGAASPWMDKLAGVYRREWYRNRLLLHAAARGLAQLHAAGIETMILKGAALIPNYYGDCGLRPMGDCDVLVPAAQRNAAIGVLVRGGWKPLRREPAALTDRVLDTRHSWGFADARGLELDLHWHALWPARGPHADDDFWARAESLELDGAATRIPDPTSLLLSVCVHGAEWEEAAPLRWIADATIILRRRGAEVEWDRLAAQAAKYHASLLLHDALAYLKASLGAAVPEDALEQLNRARVSELERRMQRAMRAAHALLGSLPILWHRYLFQREAWDGPSARDFLGFPVWLKRTLAMDTRRLAVWAASRACANAGRVVRTAARSAPAPFR